MIGSWLRQSEQIMLKRRPLVRLLQFRLRTLLLVLTAVGLWLGWQVRQAERQRQAVAAIVDAGGEVEYDFAAAHGGWCRPDWLRRLLGDDYLYDVVAVTFDGQNMMLDQRRYDFPSRGQLSAALAHLGDLPALERLDLARMLPIADGDLVHLAPLRQLKRLTLYGPQITDEGLAHLTGLTRLEQLDLSYMSATSDGVQRLPLALPGCQINFCGGQIM